MARGYPDYSVAVGKSETGEFLQVEASAPVWFSDNFESARKKWSSPSGSQNIVSRSYVEGDTVLAFEGDSMLWIQSEVGDVGAGILYIGPYPRTGYIGISLHFSIHANYLFEDWPGSFQPIGVDCRTNGLREKLGIFYNPRTNEWFYMPFEEWPYVKFAEKRVEARYWHKIKLIIDVVNKKYVRVFIDEEEFDLSGISYYFVSGDNYSFCDYDILAWPDAGEVVNVLIDKFAITYNES